MSRFDHYFQMNVGDVIEYTLEKATEIPWDRDSMEQWFLPPMATELCIPCMGRQGTFHLHQTGRIRGQDIQGYKTIQGQKPPGV